MNPEGVDEENLRQALEEDRYEESRFTGGRVVRSTTEYLRILLVGVGWTTTYPAMGAAAMCMTDVDGADRAEVTESPPNPVAADPGDGALLAWIEVENFTLTGSLLVDLVSDEAADFVTAIEAGFEIAAGTVVTTYYLQWDSGSQSPRVQSTLTLGCPFVAIVLGDERLAASDHLGRPDLEYINFPFRGVEDEEDIVDLEENVVRVSLSATTPGDWMRLVCITPPGAETPPLPCDIPVTQIAGDCNQDGTQDVSDVVCSIGQLFPGFPPLGLNTPSPCGTAEGSAALLDINGDGVFNIADVIGYADALFGGAAGPPVECGPLVARGCADNASCR